MDSIIITNNPKVNIEFTDMYNVEFIVAGNQMDILVKARDLIHMGARLIMDPVLGRMKPHETPYKSVVLELYNGTVHMESLLLIEDSIYITKKLLTNSAYIKYDYETLDGLQYIDKELLKDGLRKLRG